MALKDDRRGRSGLRYASRLLGVLGLLTAGAGAVLAAPALAPRTATAVGLMADGKVGSAAGEFGRGLVSLFAFKNIDQVGGWMLVAGLGVALLALVIEIASVAGRVAGARSAAGVNFAAQIALAVALLVLVNVYAYRNQAWIDLTRDKRFTLPEDVASQLRELKDPTTVVVYRRHGGETSLSGRQDPYDAAAEQKVSEKVRDLIGQFRRFGPRFTVEEVDSADPKSAEQLADLDRRVPGLKAAIESAPENSIFFAAPGRKAVQRLAFREFYALDKTASESASDKERSNLVLLEQGVRPFAARIFALEGRRPVVGVATAHELLSTRSENESAQGYTMAGARKALESAGFEVRDLVLKKWTRGRAPEPAAVSFEETKLDRLDAQLTAIDRELAVLRAVRRERERLQTILKSDRSEAEISRELRAELGGQVMTKEDRRFNLERLETQLAEIATVIADRERRRTGIEQERRPLEGLESVLEAKRTADLKERTKRFLDECDLLIVPRMTIRDLGARDNIDPRVYPLDEAQVAAVKEYLKSGRPMLACFGPANQDDGDAPPGSSSPPVPDGLELLLSEVGLRFGGQTILFDSESLPSADGGGVMFGSASGSVVPPLEFGAAKPGTVGGALDVTARAAGGKTDLRLKAPRPVYFVPPLILPTTDTGTPDFLSTAKESWNETEPFGEGVPSYNPPRPTDPKRGRDDERRGPFPVGVAAEVRLPRAWLDERVAQADAARLVLAAPDAFGALPTSLGTAAVGPETPNDTTPKSARIAAIGQGGVFVGPELKPAQERLLVDLCNWLLKRDDRLPVAEQQWRYPRVALDPDTRMRWAASALVGLPALFAALGVAVYLTRARR